MEKEINPNCQLIDGLVAAWIFDETQATPEPIYNPYLNKFAICDEDDTNILLRRV